MHTRSAAFLGLVRALGHWNDGLSRSENQICVRIRYQFEEDAVEQKGDASPHGQAQPAKDTSGSRFLHRRAGTTDRKFSDDICGLVVWFLS